MILKPFRAVRPARSEAAQVASVPYDVVSRAEARVLADESPHSFLRVTRAEIDLPDVIDVYSAEIYERAAENLAELRRAGILERDDEPGLYVYRLTLGNRTQTAVVGLCSLDEYDAGDIKRHEKTRPDKEDDRTNHILATRAQTGLIFLCYRGTNQINELVSTATTAAPVYDFQAADGVQHTVWRVEQPLKIINAFAEVESFYIADGHHRAASAARAREVLRKQSESGDFDFVVAALFPAEQLKILAYNRVVRDLNNLSDGDFLEILAENFDVSETAIHVPDNALEFCMYLGAGKWYKLRFAQNFGREPAAIDTLPASVLQTFLLEPVLGIADARTDKRIEFVGGARGVRELEKLVDSGEFKAAFSLFPTAIEDLLNVSDAGEIMPPKSTWFEPKLRDGLLIHVFDD